MLRSTCLVSFAAIAFFAGSSFLKAAGPSNTFRNIPADYLREPEHIPEFCKRQTMPS